MKKNIITIPLLLIATILTIFYGRKYAEEQQEEMDNNQLLVVEETTDEEVSEPSEENNDQGNYSIDDYESRLNSLSLYETLDYLSLTKDEVTVAYYGDINPEEEWYALINDYLNTAVSGNLTILDLTQPEEDTYDLYIQETPQTVAAETIDIIFYGLPALPDQIRDIGLAETEQYMNSIMNVLEGIEDVELVLIEPYPHVNEFNRLNSRSLDYRSYLGRMQEVSDERNLPLIPLHEEIINRTEENTLETFYIEDTNDLNEEGTELVISILDEWFQEEL